MKVIGAGLPRTGTMSCQAALEQLLGGDCYHMSTVAERSDHLDEWFAAFVGEDLAPMNLEYVTKGFAACVDAPLCFYYKELMELYPEAKVLLTVRDPEGWFKSWSKLIESLAPLAKVRKLSAKATRFVEFAVAMDVKYDLTGPNSELYKDEAIAAYERHVAEVKSVVPEEKLLVFSVKDGWEPLCAHLGVAVPENEPFPHLNANGTKVKRKMSYDLFIKPKVEFFTRSKKVSG